MFKTILSVAMAATLSTVAPGQTSVSSSPDEAPAAKYASISNEILRAIEKGNEYLKSQQKPEGYWGQESYPALTALPVTAYMRDPANKGKPLPEHIKKAYDIILKAQKEDGSIFNRGLASYNTSVCMMALLAANNEAYAPVILKARAYLIKQQNHAAPDSPYYGGIGYGDPKAPPTADLSNTNMALEAIYYSQKLAKDGKYGPQPELDWDAAVQFINQCQQNPKVNKQPWVSKEPSQLGGFVYRPGVQTPGGTMGPKGPGNGTGKGKPGIGGPGRPGMGGSMGGGMGGPGRPGMGDGAGAPGKDAALVKKPEPPKAYGSMTYAGMQSLIYANVDKNDERVKLAVKWIQDTYTLDENPGMGIQGLYYYYQTMSKTLSAMGMNTLTLKDGTVVDWREDLANKLISIQKGDGSWVNTNNRWWEADPVLVTCYCVLALEQLYYSIPR